MPKLAFTMLIMCLILLAASSLATAQFPTRYYLPVIRNHRTPTPTATWTPEPTPTATTDLRFIADLVVRDFTADPDDFMVGDTVHFWARIKNQGGVDASGFRMVWEPYGDDEEIITLKSDLELEAGKDQWIEWHYTYSQNRTNEYEACVIVDPDDKVKEADEGNNDKRTTITINK